VAALVSAGVTGLAWQLRALSVGGSLAGWVIGVLILIGTGWQGGAVLAAFFVSSTLISKATARRSAALLDAKGNKRDTWQVLANGGVAAVASVAAPAGSLYGLWLVTASLAAAASDTWGTSVGGLSSGPPRLWWSGRRVVPGTSGGVSSIGSAGALVGGAIVSVTAAAVAGLAWLAPAGTLIGFAGMLLDSLVGGTLQGRFHCPVCNQASEWRMHRCGTANRRTGGVAWLDNDAVNAIATLGAAGLAWIVWRWHD
jgi:uncharacterized protein (TIGR00297 family)